MKGTNISDFAIHLFIQITEAHVIQLCQRCSELMSCIATSIAPANTCDLNTTSVRDRGLANYPNCWEVLYYTRVGMLD